MLLAAAFGSPAFGSPTFGAAASGAPAPALDPQPVAQRLDRRADGRGVQVLEGCGRVLRAEGRFLDLRPDVRSARHFEKERPAVTLI